MSIKVELGDLAAQVAKRPFGYLLTAGDDGPPHSGAVVFHWEDGCLVTGAGKTTRSHVRQRQTVSLLWPPLDDGGYSLIVDGDAVIRGAGDPDSATVVVTPTWAVLHRPA